ncbi:hypothetical protein II810_05110, partial [bacterium]|nr:hypothetical protein [bacterium]
MFNANPIFRRTSEQLSKCAEDYGYSEITPLIAFKYLLEETYNYVDDLDTGKKDYKTSSCPGLASAMISDYCGNIFSEKEQREKVKPVLKKHIDILDKKIKDESPNIKDKGDKPKFSKYLADSIWSSREQKTNKIDSINLVDGVMGDKEGENEKIFINFWFDTCEALMLNKKPISERCSFSDYDNKAKDVLKHIKIGTNMFVTYDWEKEEPDSFIDTIYKNAGDNTKIIEFNKYTMPEYFINMVSKLGKDEKNKYIVIANPTNILANEPDKDDEEDWNDDFEAEFDVAKLLKKHPANVSFILYDTNDNYYKKQATYQNFE